MTTSLARLDVRAGDEIIVVDNQPGEVVPEPDGGKIRIVHDASQASSYFARNRGAEEAEHDWILFIDSDCRPSSGLLDAFFADQLPDGCGIVAGGVVSAPDQKELIAVYARTRSQVSERLHAEVANRPAGITANLLVRRSAWEEASGFQEGVRSGGDVEFCWRVQDLGWSLVHRPRAAVEHLHPTSLQRLLAKARRYGAGRVWVDRRYPGDAPPPPLARSLGRCVVGLVIWPLALQPRRGLFKLIDALWLMEMARGYWFGDNRATPIPGTSTTVDMVVIANEFPKLRQAGPASATGAVEGITSASLRVEAGARPQRPDRLCARLIPIAYREDDPPIDRLRSAIWLWARHPLRSIAAVRLRTKHSGSLAELAPAVRRLRREAPREVSLGTGSGPSERRLLSLVGLGRGRD